MMSTPINDIASLTPSCTTSVGAGSSSSETHSVRGGLLGAINNGTDAGPGPQLENLDVATGERPARRVLPGTELARVKTIDRQCH